LPAFHSSKDLEGVTLSSGKRIMNNISCVLSLTGSCILLASEGIQVIIVRLSIQEPTIERANFNIDTRTHGYACSGGELDTVHVGNMKIYMS
jgi:hypothetical protein